MEFIDIDFIKLITFVGVVEINVSSVLDFYLQNLMSYWIRETESSEVQI